MKTYLDFRVLTPAVFLSEETLAPYYPLEPARIRKATGDFYDSVTKFLSEERGRILHADPKSLFWDAENQNYSRVDNLRNLSPLRAIDNILDYSRTSGKGLPPCERADAEEFHNSMDEIYADTQRVLCYIRDQIRESKTDHKVRLKKIFMAAHLEHGTAFIEGRIRDTMELILFDKIGREKEREPST